MEAPTEDTDTAAAEQPESWRPPVVPGAERVRWFWWLCFGAGIVLAIVTALDLSPIANLFAFLLAVAAHGCLAVFIVAFLRAARDRPTEGGMRQWTWSTAMWAIDVVLFVVALYVIDRFVFGLAVSPVWKWFYGIAAALAFVTVLAIQFALFFSSRYVTSGITKTIAEWTVVGVRGLAIGVAAVLLLIAVLAWRNQRDKDDDPIVIDAVPMAVQTYVALGDSYSAGEGLDPFLPGPRPECHRSPEAYPMLLRFTGDTDVQFRACSGAVTADVDLGIVGGHEPQIDAEPDPDVDLVTITIGGNDVIFSRVVQSCFLYEDCLEATFNPPGTDRARPSVAYPPSAPLNEWAAEALELLVLNVDRVYANLTETYPEARIIVLGYPYLFPDGGAPWWQGDCATVLRRVDRDEREGLRALTDQLNATLYERANAAGIEFVSPAAAWHEHEPCGSEGQYTRAFKPRLRLLNPVDGGTFHPNRQGQRQFARLVSCYLNENPAGPPEFVDGSPPGSKLPVDVDDRSSCDALLARVV